MVAGQCWWELQCSGWPGKAAHLRLRGGFSAGRRGDGMARPHHCVALLPVPSHPLHTPPPSLPFPAAAGPMLQKCAAHAWGGSMITSHRGRGLCPAAYLCWQCCVDRALQPGWTPASSLGAAWARVWPARQAGSVEACGRQGIRHVFRMCATTVVLQGGICQASTLAVWEPAPSSKAARHPADSQHGSLTNAALWYHSRNNYPPQPLYFLS